ncbi:DnaB-like helicase N-terminal domain-containing protein, partial [uncultured Novosphingobium sp.]
MSEAPSPMLGNIEAEAALLGTLLMDNRAIEAAADRLTGPDFIEPL